MKKLSVLLLFFATSLNSVASASHDSPLYEATDRYRDVVVDFERHVIQARAYDRYDVRLVDDLEDSTSRLRSAARHAHRSEKYDDRFASALREINKLQDRVEHAIFGQACYHSSPEVIRCWQSVVHAYTDVIHEAACLSTQQHTHAEEILYRRPTHMTPPFAPPVIVAPPSFAPPIFAPPIAAPPQPIVPHRRSVNYRSSVQNHHAAMQIKIGAMLQRR
ncbi:hypothetical protein [Planctomycetes bacterium K23_9]|uniref:Uncharacterized protein n=1 Tax=Stieleria marina TaxID=1930275 RepID=A0A517P2R1_9BACT|nr:hypothetical protein K239x_56760 [Planctomycetes bacterium K23_9]